MTNPSIQTDISEVLKEIKSDQKKLLEQVNELKVGQAQLATKVENIEKEISEIKGSQNKQVWALIGIVFSAVGILGKIVFFPNP